MGELTILCNTKVDIPKEISSYWKRKDLWQDTKLRWNPLELEKLIATKSLLIRVRWNINVLFWLIQNPNQIPKEARGRNIVFEGTIFTDKDSYAYPALFWDVIQKCWTWYFYQELTSDQKVRHSYKRGDVRYETEQKNKRVKSRVVNFVRLERVF